MHETEPSTARSAAIAEPAEPRPPGWVRSLPNALTIARLVMAAVFVAMLTGIDPSETGRLFGAAALFVVAALTDAADGYLARRFDAISKFGRIADPFADKILVLGAFVMLAGPGLGSASGVQPWMVVTILSRELLVTSIRAVFEGSGADFSASTTGKLKMIAQSVGAPLILVSIAVEWSLVAEITAYMILSITVLSVLPYLWRAAELSRRGAA
ncbi:MAG: CDP-diacylglycerol--glycerol-3-phosphate 3-phosphatidyltransferase [Planctomycetota bacterium]